MQVVSCAELGNHQLSVLMMFNAEALYPYNISRTEFKTEMPDKAQCAKSMQLVSVSTFSVKLMYILVIC